MELSTSGTQFIVPKFLTGKQVEEIIQSSDETVHKLRRSGKLLAIQIGNQSYRYPADQPYFRLIGEPSSTITPLQANESVQPKKRIQRKIISKKKRNLKDLLK